MQATDGVVKNSNARSLISVIVPVYNVEKYLSRCIESILCQTHRELEVILVNDGSADKSGETCDAYAKKDSRVRVFHQENAGVSTARNAGINIATGDWIAFVDADDWLEPSMYEKLLQAGIENGTLLACCNYVRHYSEEKQVFKLYSETPKVLTGKQALIRCLTPADNPFFGRIVQFIYNHTLFKDAIDNARIRFDTSIHFCEDILLLTQILIKADRVAYIPDLLYIYYQREGSAINSVSEKRLTALCALKQLKEHVEPISHRLLLYAQVMYATNIKFIVICYCNSKQYTQATMFRCELRRFVKICIFTNVNSFKLKIEYLATLLLPKSIIGFLSRVNGRRKGTTITTAT